MSGRVGAARLGPFDALGFRFEVSCDHDGIRSVLARVLRPLGTTAPAEHRYEIVWDDDRALFVTSLDGRRVGSSPGGRLVVEELVWWINRRATEAWPGVLVHGGAVCWPDGRAVVVVGGSGTGKSTLTAALVGHGLGYLTDELVAAPVGSDRLQAYPRAISLKHGARPLLPHLDPGPPAPSEPTLSIWFVDPERIRPGATATGGSVGAIVLLDAAGHDGPLEVGAASPAETLVGLVAQTFGLGHLDQAGLETLADWCRRAPSVRVRGGTVTERVGVVTNRLRSV